MPHAALRPCSYHGCLNLVRSGRCDQHPYPDAHIAEHQELYNTHRWKRIRAAKLRKNPWCEKCWDRDHIYIVATEVHHKVAHHGDPVKFFTGELESLCKVDHARETAIEMGWGSKKVSARGATSGRGL